MLDIQALRAEHEAALMKLSGVVGVGTGEDDFGKPVLTLYISQPVPEIEAQLSPDLRELPLRFIHTGEINPHDA